MSAADLPEARIRLAGKRLLKYEVLLVWANGIRATEPILCFTMKGARRVARRLLEQDRLSRQAPEVVEVIKP